MYCYKCGTHLNESANFCHACGADMRISESGPVAEKQSDVAMPLPLPAMEPSSFSADALPRNESTPEERQALLDKFGAKLRGESIMWRLVSVLKLVSYGSMWVGLIVTVIIASTLGIYLGDYAEDEYYYGDDYYDRYDADYTDAYDSDESLAEDVLSVVYDMFFYGVTFGIYFYIPSAIFGFIMSKKAANCRKTLYEDCSIAYRRSSSFLPVIMGVFFAKLTLIFSIYSLVLTRKNSSMFSEISEMQKNYFAAIR